LWRYLLGWNSFILIQDFKNNFFYIFIKSLFLDDWRLEVYLFNTRRVFEIMSFYNNVIYYLHQYWVDIQDPRTKPYLLVDVSPWTMANIMFAYYCIVTKIGPQLMKNREPFKLRKVMFLYNFIMVLVNAYFFKEALCRIDYGKRLLNWKYPDRNNWKPETLEVFIILIFIQFSKL